MGRNIDTIATSVLDALMNYDWPGNIRALQHVLERSVILTSDNVLQVAMPELMGKAGATPLYEKSSAELPAPNGRRF